MIKDSEEKGTEGIEDKVMQAIKESGFNHSIIFLVHSDETNNKLDISAVAACAGNMDILHGCVSKLLEKDDKMYEFFADALENARQSRNKNNPNVN